MKLIGNRILLKALPKPALSSGGIVLIEAYNDDNMRFEVLQLGSKVTLDVAVGDFVLVNGYRGNLHDFEDGRIILGAEQIKNDIIAKWTSNPTSAPSAAVAENRSAKPGMTADAK